MLRDRMALNGALAQVWPPFVLVAGLLLIGLVANEDGLFERAGVILQRLPGGPVALLLSSLVLVAVVTAVLNLDTAVVFLTPILIYAARARGVEEEAYLYGAVYLANASSLYLPGSNLTNLLVLSREHVSGGAFASQMLPLALAATVSTALGLLVLFHRKLGTATAGPIRRVSVRAVGLGLPAALCAAVLTIAFSDPAIPVFAIGAGCVAVELARGRLRFAKVIRAIGPATLAGLFCLSVALGVLARSWGGPERLLHGVGAIGTSAIAAISVVFVNNLPSAMLLASRPVRNGSGVPCRRLNRRMRRRSSTNRR
jgi:arsenical pump membrane protein